MSELVTNPFAAFDNQADPLVPTATNMIYSQIYSELSRKRDTHVNRASAASLCYKRRWFQRNGYEGEILAPRAIINFMLGDLSEYCVRHFISKGCVGDSKLYSEVDFGEQVGAFPVQGGKEIVIYSQPDLVADIAGITVTAHVDGFGKRNSDGKWELIEIKSSSDYGFEEFKSDGPGSYLKQAMVNLQTNRALELGADGVRFFYIRKMTGTLWDRFFPFDKELAAEVAEEFKLANQEALPKSPFVPVPEKFRSKPTGRKILPWQCGYCPHKKECYPNITTEFKNGKPIHVIEEKK